MNPALDQLASRLDFEPGELEPLGRERATLDPQAGLGRTPGRWIIAAEGPRAPGQAGAASALGLAEAFEQSGRTAVATLAVPSPGELLALGGLAGLALGLDARLRPTLESAAVREARDVLVALAAHEGVRADWSGAAIAELQHVLAFARDERELGRALGRMRLGVGADGSERLVETTPAVPTLVALLGAALRPTLARTERGTPVLLQGTGGLGTASVAATRVALAAGDVVVAGASGPGVSGVRHALDLIAPRAGARPHAVVLSTDLAGLRLASGRLDRVQARELERVLAADDPGLAESGLARVLADARLVRSWGVPVVVGLEQSSQHERQELERLVAVLSDSDCAAVIVERAADGVGAADLAAHLDGLDPDAARNWRPASAGHADLSSKAHAAAQAAGAVGDLALLPEPAQALVVWAQRGWAQVDVLVQGARTGTPWTIEHAALETGARLVRLTAQGAVKPALGPPTWSRLGFDAWGRIGLAGR